MINSLKITYAFFRIVKVLESQASAMSLLLKSGSSHLSWQPVIVNKSMNYSKSIQDGKREQQTDS